MRYPGVTLAAAVSLCALTAATAAAEPRVLGVQVAQAGPGVAPQSEAEKRAKELRQREQDARKSGGGQRPPESRGSPPPPRQSQQPPPPPRSVQQPPPQQPVQRRADPPPPGPRGAGQPDRGPPPTRRDAGPSQVPPNFDRRFVPPPTQPPPVTREGRRDELRREELRREELRRAAPPQTPPVTREGRRDEPRREELRREELRRGAPPPPGNSPSVVDRGGSGPGRPFVPNTTSPGRRDPAVPPALVGPAPTGPRPGVTPPTGLRFEDVRAGRSERREAGGRRTVIQEPGAGNRVIIKQDNRTFIHHDETARFKRLNRDAQTRRRPDGFSETFYVRPDGVRVVTVTDRHGRLVQRYRRDGSGREHSIIDNRRFIRNAAVAAGIGVAAVAVALAIAPPRVAIARERYIVDYERASEEDIYEALSAPPIERLERSYSLEEVRYSYPLRQRMRRVDVDTIVFDLGSYEVTNEQYPKLERIARIMRRLLERDPNEVFLVGAHTDAVGGTEDNLSLSDRRAESVATILSEQFGVPPENLVTQGYGEQHLKVETSGPEVRNRRVEIQRITPLLSQQQ